MAKECAHIHSLIASGGVRRVQVLQLAAAAGPASLALQAQPPNPPPAQTNTASFKTLPVNATFPHPAS